jgi:phytoene dehydrogenase-like protein
MGQTAASDAIVVGAGPNGLSAAIEIARAGRTVTVLEAEERLGGGARSAALTLPGFVHDVCSAIHPLASASPFFRSLPLERYGLEFITPPRPLAHPFDDGTAAFIERSLEKTALGFGRDGPAYHRMMAPLIRKSETLLNEFLHPLPGPRHPFLMARFGISGLRSATSLAKSAFKEERSRAIFGGIAAHAMVPLTQAPTGAFALVLGMTAHTVGWPLPRGGSQRISDALAAHLGSLGGTVVTGRRVAAIDDLPTARAYLFNLTPRQLLAIAGRRFPAWYRNLLERYRYGPGVFKLDWALDGPIPWRATGCLEAGTVHVGGSIDEIAAAERAVAKGQVPERPFVLVAQQSLFDDSRAPAGKHTGWAYCHVPNGSTADMTERIEAQVERFAPGFSNRILARSVMFPKDVEKHNANCIGGDINGGLADLRQLFFRPTPLLYRTPDRAIYICSSATPPTGGVHGMCGYNGARAALKSALRNAP